MKTLIALFEQYVDANRAVDELTRHGFTRDAVSIIARETAMQQEGRYDQTRTVAQHAWTGAGGGATVGGIAGLLAGVGALAIPGIGPVIAAGSVAAALAAVAGGGLGAATGGIVGALIGLGVTQDDADAYAEGVKRGGVLVVVQSTDAQIDTADQILRSSGAIDINIQRDSWRQQGWSQFDEATAPDDQYPRLGV